MAAAKFDKSLEEIIREKGIQKPAIKKKKNQVQMSGLSKIIGRKSCQQKYTNDQKNQTEAKCSVIVSGKQIQGYSYLLR